MPLGPVQIVVLGFAEPEHGEAVRRELERLREGDVIRVLDSLVVRKHENGTMEYTFHEERDGAGTTVRALIGDDGDEQTPAPPDSDGAGTWYVDDAIPAGTAAAVALIEHRWAIPLRTAVGEAGGALLAEAWLHPSDLASVGLLDA
jgi:hypothetical protein